MARKVNTDGCNVDGCDKPFTAKGLCNTHYRRWQKTGDPSNGGRFTMTLQEKFERRMPFRPADGSCWIWTGVVDKDGYGEYKVHGHRRAHRVAYTIYKGPIPAGMLVLHSCDVPSCCNPQHLSVGTQKRNMDDMIEKGRGYNGVGHHRAKLTEAQVRRIRDDYRQGVSTLSMAEQYGVAWTTIKSVATYRTWKHVS